MGRTLYGVEVVGRGRRLQSAADRLYDAAELPENRTGVVLFLLALVQRKGKLDGELDITSLRLLQRPIMSKRRVTYYYDRESFAVLPLSCT